MYIIISIDRVVVLHMFFCFTTAFVLVYISMVYTRPMFPIRCHVI